MRSHLQTLYNCYQNFSGIFQKELKKYPIIYIGLQKIDPENEELCVYVRQREKRRDTCRKSALTKRDNECRHP